MRSEPASVPAPADRPKLDRGLGVRDAIAMSVSGMGPMLSMNLNPQEPARHVGAAVPLVFVVSGLLLLLVAWCFAHLSRRHSNAGSAYGFVLSVLGPRAGLFAGWVLFGTYFAFALCSLAGFGLFRSDVATRLHVLDHPTSMTFTVIGALLVAAICATSTKRATDVLTLIQGIAVLAMFALSCAVFWQVAFGEAPGGATAIDEVFVPRAGLGPSEMALALSFAFLSFAGFEEAATLGEEVRDAHTTIPRVLVGSILGAGALYTLVTAAEVLGFGADAAGLGRLTSSKSLLADLAETRLGPACGDFMDALAVLSALGCGLASVLAASRILYAIARDLAPSSRWARLSAGGTPLAAALLVVAFALLGCLVMRLGFGANGSDAFFWGSTLGALGLLVAYFMVVLSAGVSLLRELRDGRGDSRAWAMAIPVVAGASIAYTLLVNVYPPQSGAYAVLPWIVLGWCAAPLVAVMLRPGIARRIGAPALALLLLAVAPANADPPSSPHRPNVLVVLVDDAAFTDFGAYGGEARTPTIDRLVARGARFGSHHSSPLCSPSRAMLLTGVDNHRTGVATIEEVLPPDQAGKPGYSLHLEPGVRTIADRLKAAGYRTYMSGKWHLGHGPGDLPNAHGFDRSLALDASGADNWAPKPYMPYYQDAPWFEDGAPAKMPASYYSSELIVDRLLGWLRADAARPEPFLAYVAFQAVHIPVQAPAETIAHYEGRFDAGWESLRDERWRRAIQMGLVPADAPLDPMPAALRSWASLREDERRIFAQSMAVYAAMLESMDFHLGRLLGWLEESGRLDDTIVVVTSDNGPEPSDPVHAPGMGLWMWFNGYSWRLDGLGGPGSLTFIGPEWAASVSSPGRLFKFYAAEGGLRVPLVVAGPGIVPGTRVASASFVTDVAPTLLDLADVGQDGGVAMTGRSLRPVLAGQATRAHPADEPVGMEVSGNSALFKGDWKLVRNMPPWGDGRWHLHDLASDPGETSDLASARPEVFAELRRDYESYEREMGVLPLPPGYDPHDQVARNSIRRQVRAYGSRLALGAATVVAGFALALRSLWRRRRAA